MRSQLEVTLALRPEPLHDEAAPQYREIIALAVEGDQHGTRVQQLDKHVEHGPLLGGVVEEELVEDEGLALKQPNPDEEGERPRSVVESGRLDIEEQGVLRDPILEARIAR